jgi:hypothetical protein
MKNLSKLSWSIALLSVVMLAFMSCKTEQKQPEKKTEIKKNENVVEILTTNMEFQMPDTISSGWNTFRYINQSPQTHFFTIEKYPEGKTMKDVDSLVIPYFDSGMKLINEGKPEEGFAEFGKLPEWFGEVKILGGVALVSPGKTAETSFKLDPGHYFIECYVKMSNGVFHASVGMFSEFDVSEEDSGNMESKADYAIEISSTEGIVFDENITAGDKTFSVYFKDQTVHENFAGHDINLGKLDESADLDAIEKWMNWVDPKGLIDPAPEGVTFLGGVNNMPAGSKAYFKAKLEPGRYILISEVPNAKSKNLLKTFEVLN